MVRFLSNKLFGMPSKYITFSMDTDGTQVREFEISIRAFEFENVLCMYITVTVWESGWEGYFLTLVRIQKPTLFALVLKTVNIL